MINFATEINQAVTALELFRFYGFEVNTAGFCRSPFADNDNTPSLKVYGGTRGWHDFSSGKGGDVIDFVREYFGLSFTEAQKKINADFALGLPIGERLTQEEQAEADRKSAERRRQQEQRQMHLTRLMMDYNMAYDRWVYLDTLRRKNKPTSPERPISDEYAYAVKNIDRAGYELDVAEIKLKAFESRC